MPARFNIGIALRAAFRPAPSLSKVSTTSFTYLLISIACWSVNAVPSAATALVKPALCKAITSIYPSHISKYGFLLILAKFIPYRLRLFSNILVSGELRYFGSPSPITRPPKPITRLLISRIGNITLFQNLS